MSQLQTSNKTHSNEFNMELWKEFLESVLRRECVWDHIFLATLLFIIFIVSLVGNLLTCVVIYYDRTMHTLTNYYLFNLAVSDLIVTFAILLDVLENLGDGYLLGHVMCKIHFFFVVMLWNNSTLIMTALAIERYIAIWHPLLLKPGPAWRRVMKIILAMWLVAIIESLPEMWAVELINTQQASLCFTVPTTYARTLNGVLAVVTFAVPLVIMTFVYTMIAFKVNVNETNNSMDKIFNHRDNRSRVNKLSVALTLSFLLCWLPFFAMRVLIFAFDMRQLMRLAEWWSIGHRFATFNSWFSTVLNPILFSLMSTKFRKAFKTLWNDKIRRMRHSEIHNF